MYNIQVHVPYQKQQYIKKMNLGLTGQVYKECRLNDSFVLCGGDQKYRCEDSIMLCVRFIGNRLEVLMQNCVWR